MIPVAAVHRSLSLTYGPERRWSRPDPFDACLVEELVGMANDDGEVPMIEAVSFVIAVRPEWM
jgi:hypothetical protein